MSKFFQALQRAEQERFLRREGWKRNPNASASDVPVHGFAMSSGRDERAREESPPYSPFHSQATAEIPESIDQHLVSLVAPTTFEAEQYRSLRHTVEQLHRETGALSLVAVSSPTVGDGKTTTAINLAGAFAQNTDIRVLLIDMDLRRPSVIRALGLDNGSGPGLVDIIADPRLSLQAVARPCPPFNLSIVPAGRSLSNPYEVLKSFRLGELLEEARRSYDYVIIDTPPLIPFPDCRLIERWIDGFLVVVSAHQTPRKLVEEAIESLNPTKVTGLVFNTDDQPVFGYYYYYDYAYGQSSIGKDRARPTSWMVKKLTGLFKRQKSSHRHR
jgi:protein-tyrosine kinase